MEQTATQIIEQVKDDMCNHYCKYTDDSYASLEQDEVYEKCEECPLNRI